LFYKPAPLIAERTKKSKQKKESQKESSLFWIAGLASHSCFVLDAVADPGGLFGKRLSKRTWSQFLSLELLIK
jgi:hypothetical protein